MSVTQEEPVLPDTTGAGGIACQEQDKPLSSEERLRRLALHSIGAEDEYTLPLEVRSMAAGESTRVNGIRVWKLEDGDIKVFLKARLPPGSVFGGMRYASHTEVVRLTPKIKETNRL